MGALKAGATVSVIDPQYPPERQKVLLDVARPRFLVCIQKANEDAGPPSDLVLDFVASSLRLRSTIPALELCDNGELKGGCVDGKDCLDASVYSREDPVHVFVGPDSVPTLSFTSGSEGRPKAVQGRHFSLTHYLPWMAEKFGLSDQDRFTMLSGIAHDPIQVSPRSSYCPYGAHGLMRRHA
jgi:L-2-aminoadipate reductase